MGINNIIMQIETLTYIAKKLVEDIRNGYPFSKPLLLDMNSFPIVDYLREEINEQDSSIILSLINHPNFDYAYLGLNLVNKVLYLQEIQKALFDLWAKEECDYKLRYFLMWPILNIETTNELRQEIYRFATQNYGRWIEDCVTFAGGKEKVVEFSFQRFYDKKFPLSKRWIYILPLKILENKTDILLAVSKLDINNQDYMQKRALSFVLWI